MSHMYQSECCALSYSRFVTFPTHESFVFVSILFSSFAWFFWVFFLFNCVIETNMWTKKGIEHKNNEMQWKIVMTIIATKQLANLMFHWIRIIFLVYECFCSGKKTKLTNKKQRQQQQKNGKTAHSRPKIILNDNRNNKQ